jgi:LysM repeat protein
MNKHLCILALWGTGLILSACTWPSAATPTPPLTLVVQVQNPADTLDSVGDTINYTYTITNTGTERVERPITITDDKVAIDCPGVRSVGNQDTFLDPSESLTCTGTYSLTQADLDAHSVTNSATASGAGGSIVSAPNSFTVNLVAGTPGIAQASPLASATVTSGIPNNITPSITPGPSNLTRGSTIQHTVEKGEWMIQIARCYGVSYESLRSANSQISNPAFIELGQVLTVPNIGSAGTIYGKPCVVFHTVAAGDTWNSIATRYNARVDVLQEANRGGLVTGAQIKVPINSAGAGAVQVPVTGVTGTNTATSTITPTYTATVTATVATPIVTIVSNTPTVTPTVGTATGGSNRITAGATPVPLSGVLAGHETISFVLAANQGQTMSVSLAAAANEIGLRIQDPTGTNIKQLDGILTWTRALPATGDYRIDLVGLTDASKNYALTVTLTGP